ncbi:hypothetical protein D9M68_615870 [compost metagenome]
MKQIEKKLTEKRIKPTAMRLLVLDALLKQSAALSLTDLELSMDRTDRVTYIVQSGLLKNMDWCIALKTEQASQSLPCVHPAAM